MTSDDQMTWMNVVARVGLNAVTYPIEYAKVLMQLGHEPMIPYKSRTVFGREKLYYPNIFSYVKYIKNVDGFSGCYRGLSATLTANVISGVTYQHIMDLQKEDGDGEENEDTEMTVKERTRKFVMQTFKESRGRICSLVASQPFHVIAVRTMAEFVGHDGKYTGIFASMKIIYKQEGLSGFFSGLVPRILYDLGCLWLGGVVIHIINNYVVEDKDIKAYIRASVRFLSNAVMYPLQVVSSCMTANGCGLVAASPPRMRYYNGWTDCFGHLRASRALQRGSSLLWRPVTGSEFHPSIHFEPMAYENFDVSRKTI